MPLTAKSTRASRPEPEARRLVGRQLAFLGHLLLYLLACLLLVVVAGPFPAAIVALAWGIGLAMHGFFAVAAPMMRGPLERHTAEALAPPREREGPRSSRSLEELSAAIAHEIRNPITAAKSLVQQIAEDPAAPENAEYAAVAVAELDRVERSIVHLLRFAREESLVLGEARMPEVVQSAVDTLRDRSTKLGACVRVATEDTGAIRGDADKLRDVVVNLLANALDAVEEAKREAPKIEIESGSNLARTEVWVAVRDDGPGFDEADLSKVFAPFHTSKKAGTGLGLALAKKTIEAHGGTIEARTRPEGGAEVIFSIPRGEVAS